MKILEVTNCMLFFSCYTFALLEFHFGCFTSLYYFILHDVYNVLIYRTNYKKTNCLVRSITFQYTLINIKIEATLNL